MKNKFRVFPKRIARSRKIQVRQFEPEEIWIEYELEIKDPAATQEAIQEATRLALDYLNAEETRLRGIGRQPVGTNNQVGSLVTEYKLEITDLGKQKNLQVVQSKEPQFVNFIHLWHGNNGKDPKTYIGHLRKDTGEFKPKIQNKVLIEKNGIELGTHFKVIPA